MQANPWFGKIPWRRARQCIPVFLPGEFHGQKSLVSCSPQGHKQLDTTEGTCTNMQQAATYQWVKISIQCFMIILFFMIIIFEKQERYSCKKGGEEMKQVGQNFTHEAQGLVHESRLHYSTFLCLRLSSIVSVKIYLSPRKLLFQERWRKRERN